MTKAPKLLSYIIGLVLVVVPFHAFFTVWLSSGIGHYTAVRLWDEVLLFILSCGALYLLWQNKALIKKLFASRLSRLIAAYVFITLIWAVVPYVQGNVTAKAMGYGLIVNLRYLIFFLAVWVISAKSNWLKSNWPKLLLIPAVFVVIFGILQALVLPYDFLKHFGYNSSTIFPYETINHNLHYIRAMSTLRGANPLGAYLIIIISSLATWLLKVNWRKWKTGIFSLAALLTLIVSYSREAWLGIAASLVFLGWMSIKTKRVRQAALAGGGILLVVCIVAAIGLRHNTTFQNYFLHTQTGSTIKTSSNAQHSSALRQGLHDLVHQPLGKGVGTAGPASVYNNGHARIAENYFVQIGQETGWLGLAVFLAIYIGIGWELWLKRQNNLAVMLLASLIGLTIVSMLSHAWTDDTLAYIWWGLAGVALAPTLANASTNKRSPKVA